MPVFSVFFWSCTLDIDVDASPYTKSEFIHNLFTHAFVELYLLSFS